MATAPTLKKMPPPPPIAANDPMFNRWLHDLQAFIADGGGVDPGVIPGYGTLISTVATHTTEINSNTASISTNTSNIAVNSANIATNSANIATHSIQIANLTARSQVLNGTAAPAAGLGANGDWYADTSGHHIHVKTGGAWVQIV